MNDFDKNKVGFIIALIASNFSLYPILKDMRKVVHLSFEPSFISFNYAYWIFNIFLGISIYFYAFSFIRSNAILPRTKKLADLFFTIATLLPIFYIIYYLVCYLLYIQITYRVRTSSGMLITDNQAFNILEVVLWLVFVFSARVIYKDIKSIYNFKNIFKYIKDKINL